MRSEPLKSVAACFKSELRTPTLVKLRSIPGPRAWDPGQGPRAPGPGPWPRAGAPSTRPPVQPRAPGRRSRISQRTARRVEVAQSGRGRRPLGGQMVQHVSCHHRGRRRLDRGVSGPDPGSQAPGPRPRAQAPGPRPRAPRPRPRAPGPAPQTWDRGPRSGPRACGPRPRALCPVNSHEHDIMQIANRRLGDSWGTLRRPLEDPRKTLARPSATLGTTLVGSWGDPLVGSWWTLRGPMEDPWRTLGGPLGGPWE